MRAEGPVVEAAPVSQPSTISAEAQGRDEDDAEADRGREQLGGGEQLTIPGRFADSPSALRSQAGHRISDLAEHQRFAHLGDDGKVDGAAGCEKLIERRVEVRLSGQRCIGKKGTNRCFSDEVPRGGRHGARRRHGTPSRRGVREWSGSRVRLGGSGLRRCRRHGRRRGRNRLSGGAVRASGADAGPQLRLRSL